MMDVLRHLGGVQGQAPNPPYAGLWTRVAGFRIADLTELLEAKQAVRSTIHRATLHVLASDDFVAFRAMAQPIFERGLRGSWGRWLGDTDTAAVLQVGEEFFAGEPRSAFELRHLLSERWPGVDPLALTAVCRYLMPLVQVPPSGLWEYYKPALLTPAERWLGTPLAPAGEPDALIRRYLAAFGPATAQDFSKWSGITNVSATFARLRPELRRFQAEDGTLLFDLPGMPMPSEHVAAPVRLLPEWDNLLLAYAAKTRRRVLPEQYRGRVFTNNGLIRATILVDGFVAGTWKVERTDGAPAFGYELFEPADRATIEAIEAIEAEGAAWVRTMREATAS